MVRNKRVGVFVRSFSLCRVTPETSLLPSSFLEALSVSGSLITLSDNLHLLFEAPGTALYLFIIFE